MDLFGTILPILAVIAVVGVLYKMTFGSSKTNCCSGRGGIQPLTGAGPKPGQKLSNIRAARPRVRPTSRRMRTGGTAYMLRRDEYATDLLFFIALDAALGYDEIHYGLVDFVDSPFLNDEFDYSGSDFEDYSETETELPVVVVESDYLSATEEPEAASFEELNTTTEDDTTKYGGGDDSSDFGGSDDSGGDDW